MDITFAAMKCIQINRTRKSVSRYHERFERKTSTFAKGFTMYPWTSLKEVDDPNQLLNKFFNINNQTFYNSFPFKNLSKLLLLLLKNLSKMLLKVIL